MSNLARVAASLKLFAIFLGFFLLTQLPMLFAMIHPAAIEKNIASYFYENPQLLCERAPEYSLEDIAKLNQRELLHLVYEKYTASEFMQALPTDRLLSSINGPTYLMFELIVLAVYGFMWNREERRLQDLAPVSVSRRTWLLICMGAACILLTGNALLDILRTFGFVENRDDLSSIAEQGFLLFILAVTFIGPLVEEFFMRGILFSRLRAITSLKNAILISSFVFAIVHGFTFNAVCAFFVGIYLAVVFIRSGQIRTALMAHMAANGLNYVIIILFSIFLEGFGIHVGDGSRSHNFLGLLLLFSVPMALYCCRELNRILPPLPDLNQRNDPYAIASEEVVVTDITYST